MPDDLKRMTQQSFTLPLHPHLAHLRDRATAEDRSMSSVVRRLIEKDIAEREAKAA